MELQQAPSFVYNNSNGGVRTPPSVPTNQTTQGTSKVASREEFDFNENQADLVDGVGEEETSDYYQVSDEIDATKFIAEELEQIALFAEFPDKKVYLGTGLSPVLRLKIIEILKANFDCFAWLKNDGATYQRLVNKMFRHQIGKSIEVYIDDMLVKYLSAGSHLTHLQETFDILRKYNIKLNPEKCAFGVGSGTFLGLLVSQRRIELNPDKIKAIEDIHDQSTCLKDVQRLIGRLAALSRFISRSSKKCHYFFSILKKKNDFMWTAEFQQAMKDLIRYFSSPLLMSKQKEGEELLIYLAVSKVACHPITIVTTFLLRNVLHKPELSGRLAKWTVAISEFDMEYKTQTATKSQVLADFMVDFSPKMMPLAAKEAVLVSGIISGVWTLFTDGASNVKGSDLGIVLITPSGKTLRQAIRSVPLTNNEAKYEALFARLELARGLGSVVIEIKCDSQLGIVSNSHPKGRERGGRHVGIFMVVHGNERSRLRCSCSAVALSFANARFSSHLRTRICEDGVCICEGGKFLRGSHLRTFYRFCESALFAFAKILVANATLAGVALLRIYDALFAIATIIGEPAIRYSRANEEAKNEAMLIKLNLLEEHRNLAYVRMMAQKQRMKRYYNRRANLRHFNVRDLILRKVTQSTREVNAGKLGPTWEGPYQISVITSKDSYKLENQDGVELPSN
ncbi:uncharacterized protein [Nicotiana tomentosiformis]|uniref:uncharacterized protein n=1 Tax=Nicotiana tomentosiformis TaxID=4098 RepID=UPI00388C5D89